MAPTTIFVVQKILEFQREAGFVFQDFPSDGAVPDENITIHAANGIASTGALGEVGIEYEIAVCDLGSKSIIVVPVGGVLCRRSGVPQAVGIDLGEDRGLEPVIVERESEIFTRIEGA